MMTGLALFATGEVVVKYLAQTYDVLQVVWARYTFHGLLFLLIFSKTGIIQQIKTSRPGLQFTRSILLLSATVFFFTAIQYLPLADAVAINFVAPLIVTALSIPFLGEKVGIRRWIAIFVGFAGVLVIIRPGVGQMHWAAILPLGTAICYAIYQILTRIASRTEDPKTSLFWTSAVGILVTSAAVPFFWKTPDAEAWALMISTGLLFGLGHYLLIRGFEVTPASILSPFHYTQIIWATLGGYLAFGNLPDEFTITGAAIVIGSGLYVWWREARGGENSGTG